MSATRHRRIALLVDRLGNEYTETTLAEVSAAAREHGLGVVCFVGGRLMPEDLTHNRHFTLEMANAKTVDALLVLPLGGHIDTAQLEAFCRRYDPLPLCSIAVPWTSYPSVAIENDTGFAEIIRHLIEVHERKQIAFVRGPERNAEAELRFRVYRQVLAEQGIAFDPKLVAPGSFDQESGVTAVQLLLDERQASFNAVVAANDAMATGTIAELKRRHIVVPDDVAVVGFDDVDMSRYLDPSLTTVRQPLAVQARLALRSVVTALSGQTPPRHTVLQALTVIRESCGCAEYLLTREANHQKPLSEELDVGESMRALHIAGAPETSWPEQLQTAFLAELLGEGAPFLAELGAVIRSIAAANGDLGALQKAMTILQQCILPDADDAARAHALLHAARVEICAAAERVPARRMLLVEHLSQLLLLTNHALATAVDLPSLGAALGRLLPGYHITRCFVCRHEGGDAARARLVVAYVDGRTMPLPAAGVTFPSEELLPDHLLDGPAAQSYLVLPLGADDEPSGYVVFDQGPVDGFVYMALVDQIGAALQKIPLLDRLVVEAKAREMAEAEHVEREMALARDIQTGFLPRTMRAVGLEVAATMRPATEVGGDYYDVIPTADGCWIGIGDVAGHGLPTGLVMLMLQSVVSGLVRKKPNAAPSEILQVVNAVLFDNVRRRMEQDEHITLTLLRYHPSGHVAWAGAHEDILICRASGGIEWIPTAGTWVAAVPDIRQATRDRVFELAPGDLMILYSDGVMEARDREGEPFGIERFESAVLGARERRVEEIRDVLLDAVAAWSAEQDDDVTVLVARQVGV